MLFCRNHALWMSIGLNCWPAEKRVNEHKRTGNPFKPQPLFGPSGHWPRQRTPPNGYHQLFTHWNSSFWATWSAHVKAHRPPVAWLWNTVKMVRSKAMSERERSQEEFFLSKGHLLCSQCWMSEVNLECKAQINPPQNYLDLLFCTRTSL